jgi:hypothetical protein
VGLLVSATASTWGYFRLYDGRKAVYDGRKAVPFSAGFHLGMLTGSFTVLRFPLNGGGTETEPDTVYSELFTGAIYLDKSAEIDRYNGAFGEIWAAALDDDSSRDRIWQAAEELRHG